MFFIRKIQAVFAPAPEKLPVLLLHNAAFTGHATIAIPKHGHSPEPYERSKNYVCKNNNKLNVPEAKAAMNKFKMEAASEVGVNLKEGYNGHLTSREAGSVGGQMVKKMIESYEKNL